MDKKYCPFLGLKTVSVPQIDIDGNRFNSKTQYLQTCLKEKCMMFRDNDCVLAQKGTFNGTIRKT